MARHNILPGMLAIVLLLGGFGIVIFRPLDGMRGATAGRVGDGAKVTGVIEGAKASGAIEGGELRGLCEASSILPWEGGFLIADNETEDSLHAFDASLQPRPPLPLPEIVEDIEAIALLPAGLLVVGSQGANKKGKPKPLREKLLLLGSASIRPDLSGCPACERARPHPPKEAGLSVEGAVWWMGSLYLGLRSPLQGGKARLLRMEGDPAVELHVAEERLLDLGGQGIRELVPLDKGILVLTGPADAERGAHRLYELASPDGDPRLWPIVLPCSAEGVARAVDGSFIAVTDGDGEPGEPCRTPARWVRFLGM